MVAGKLRGPWGRSPWAEEPWCDRTWGDRVPTDGVTAWARVARGVAEAGRPWEVWPVADRTVTEGRPEGRVVGRGVSARRTGAVTAGPAPRVGDPGAWRRVRPGAAA